MDINLFVGAVGRCRDGSIVHIVKHDCDPSYPFDGDNGRSYRLDGFVFSPGCERPKDIIEVVNAPADCVTKELRELAAHVTKEVAELHARIAKLEQPDVVSWDGRPDSPGDPFAVDWSEAPDWAMWRAVDANGGVHFYKSEPEVSDLGPWWRPAVGEVAGNRGRHHGDCKDWRQSLRRRPAPEFKRGDRVMVRDDENRTWGRAYFVRMSAGRFPYVAASEGPWTFDEVDGVRYRFCRHPTSEELEGY